MKEFAIFRGYLMVVMTITQKAVSLYLAKFHMIPILRLMISTSVFLPYAMISGARESLEKS